MSAADQNSNVVARKHAIAAVDNMEVGKTSLISYQSAGHLLIISDRYQTVNTIVGQLGQTLESSVLYLGEEPEAKFLDIDFLKTRQESIQLSGHLGAFRLSERSLRGDAQQPDEDSPRFDLVLDTLDQPLIAAEIKPPGYFHTPCQGQLSPELVDEISSLTGEFERPKFYDYDPQICAHGRSGQTGCTRCLEACPAEAISSLVETIQVNDELCHGFGVCSSVCPTGAIRYNYPSGEDSQNRLKTLIGTYLQEGGRNPQLLILDETSARELEFSEGENWHLPGHVLPIILEEQGSLGIDSWLSALAYGAKSVALLRVRSLPKSVVATLEQQMMFARSILGAMHYPEKAISWVYPADISDENVSGLDVMPELIPGNFAAQAKKRNTLFMAIDHLADQAKHAPLQVSLPEDAPFGQILVERGGCTLCMSCVSVCPAQAMADGGDVPKLSFYYQNCVQCGLCLAACPEQVISLKPEFVFDREMRRKARVLNEEKPFHCIRCQKPFATQSMISRITAQLAAHSMFQSEAAMQRLKMCEDCRVIELLREEQGRTEQ